MDVNHSKIKWKKYFRQGDQNIYYKSMDLRKKALREQKFLREKSKRGKDHITEGFIYPVMEFFNAGGCKHSRILNSGSNNKYTSQQCGKLIGGEKLYAHRK